MSWLLSIKNKKVLYVTWVQGIKNLRMSAQYLTIRDNHNSL